MTRMPGTPNVETQREAMKKLGFLAGHWSGEARILRGPGQFMEMAQTETAELKLGGLVLMIEGVGRAEAEGTPVLQAIGLISFDDESETYWLRAFNDGRWLESEVKLMEGDRAISWGFTLGEIKTNSTLRLNEQGEWTEYAEITIGDRPPQKLMDLVVRRVSRNL
jgi:hypothetical protein